MVKTERITKLNDYLYCDIRKIGKDIYGNKRNEITYFDIKTNHSYRIVKKGYQSKEDLMYWYKEEINNATI